MGIFWGNHSVKLDIILDDEEKFRALFYGLRVFSENGAPENSMDKCVLILQWFEIPRRLDKSSGHLPQWPKFYM